MQRVKLILHMVAILASAMVSALTASGFGGDPIVGASLGAAVSSGTAVLLGTT